MDSDSYFVTMVLRHRCTVLLYCNAPAFVLLVLIKNTTKALATRNIPQFLEIRSELAHDKLILKIPEGYEHSEDNAPHGYCIQ